MRIKLNDGDTLFIEVNGNIVVVEYNFPDDALSLPELGISMVEPMTCNLSEGLGKPIAIDADYIAIPIPEA